MADHPKNQHIAVFIPTAHCRTWLGSAIESMLQQTYPHRDIYVVDDCSGDADSELVNQYPEVSFLAMKTPAGPYLIGNMLIQMTRSAYIAFQDADDLSHRGRLERQVNEMRLQGWDGCGTWCIHVDLCGSPIGFETFPAIITKQTLTDYQYPVRHPSTLYHRYVFDRLKGFDNNTRFGADTEFLFRSLLSFRIGNVQQFLYRHTIRPDSLTQEPGSGYFSAARNRYNTQILENMQAVIEKKMPVPKAGFLLNGQQAGMQSLPAFELLQLGRGNKTWIV